jgi:hypothetical protein
LAKARPKDGIAATSAAIANVAAASSARGTTRLTMPTA